MAVAVPTISKIYIIDSINGRRTYLSKKAFLKEKANWIKKIQYFNGIGCHFSPPTCWETTISSWTKI